MTPPAAAARAPSRPFAPPAPARPRRVRPAPRPRRVSGPAREARPAARAHTPTPLVLGLAALWRRLTAYHLLDRLIAGKAWIALVAFALIGIVTLQLALLELNGGIGRVLERASTLQRENAALSIENSEIAAGSRVEGEATKLGMTVVPASALRFLSAHPASDVAHASGALSQAAHPASSSHEASTATTAGGESSAGESSGGKSASGESSGGESSSGETTSGETTPSASTSGESSSAEASSPSTGSGSATPAHETSAGEGGAAASAAGGAESSPQG